MKRPAKLTRNQKILLSSLEKKGSVTFQPANPDHQALMAHMLVHQEGSKLILNQKEKEVA